MYKTVSITIGGQLFHIEEAAYQKLDAYLLSIRGHFASYPESDEIVSDIEDRIAEGLASKLSARKKAVGEKDVDQIIAAMGTVKDFEEFDSTLPEEEKRKPDDAAGPKKWGRLYRDGEEKVLGGVCAGIAKYFNIDPVIPRLIFGLSILAGGTGVIIYILLWIILPQAKTASEKVEMAQGTVTIAAIRERIEEAIPGAKNHKSKVAKAAVFPFMIIGAFLQGVGKMLRIILPILTRILGGIIAIAGAFGIAALTTFFVLMITSPQAVIVDFPLWEVMGRMNWLVLASAGYIMILMPLAFVILAGASLLALRSAFSTTGTIALTAIWFMALTTGMIVATTVAPQVEVAAERYGQEETRTVDKKIDASEMSFATVEAHGNVRVDIARGQAYSVLLQGQAEDVEDTSVLDEGDSLMIVQNHRSRRCFFFCRNHGITVQVTMPALSGIHMTGASRAQARGFTYGSGSIVTLEASGASRINMDASPATMHANVSGASRVTLAGDAQSLKAELDGASALDASGFAVQEGHIAAHGASRATLNVSKALSGEVTGASRIFYVSHPAALSVDVSGAGRVEQRDVEEDSELHWD